MYLSFYGEAKSERIVEKSRFIAYTAHVEGEEEARAFLAKVAGEHPQATHICYGFIADKTGNLQRFSDAGEPQGTAGMPILGVLKARGLYESAIAVVRYFGGIKLGAGGLTRAYSASAAEGCGASEIREYDGCVELSVTVGYPEVNALLRFFAQEGCMEQSRDFGESALFRIAVREGECAAFRARLLEYLSGRAEIRETEKYIYPFPASE